MVGVLPLLAYNVWAFGSPTHLAYSDLDDHHAGFFGVGVPDPAVALELLLTSRGLLTLAPILVLALAGLLLLHRSGRRAEARAVGAIALVYLLYNAGYWLPYGGEVPGPRFMISVLPFLGVPLALGIARLPGPAIGLGIASAVAMATATITDPLVENDFEARSWAAALAAGDFQRTFLSGVADGWLSVLPFFVLTAASLALAAAAAGGRRLGLSGRQALLGAAAVLGWAIVAVLAPEGLGIDASAGARIAAAGGSAVAGGGPPLRELAALAAVASLVGLALAFVASRAPGRVRALVDGLRRRRRSAAGAAH